MALFGEIFWSIACIFLFCEFGNMVTIEFEDLNEIIGQLNWYSYPNDVQRMMPIIMIVAQESVIIHGYGNIACVRESFVKVGLINNLIIQMVFITIFFIVNQVVNGGFSYFMVLREFGN